MSEPSTDPVPYVDPIPPPVVKATAVELTPADQEEIDRLYAKLKPEAIAEARSHVMAHTPPKYGEAMLAKIDADFPPPAP